MIITNLHLKKKKEKKFSDELKKIIVIRSSVPLMMKRELKVTVKMEGSLQIKRRVVANTHQNRGHDLKADVQSNRVLSTNHIIDKNINILTQTTMKPMKYPKSWKSIVKKLKELTLGISDDPRPIFVSAIEKDEYFQVTNGI